jgi:pyruvate ferredoxin oxidoreductase delta subunit
MNNSIKHDITKAPKTGDWRYETPMVDKEKCIGCGTCVKFCPEAAIIVERETYNVKRENEKRFKLHASRCATIDYKWCKGCGVCAAVCPVKAIAMKK